MPFVRFSRDKRGYDHIYLVDVFNRHGRASESRILYWYRTPPGIKLGREPFDTELQRTLEAQYPDVHFDWPGIVNTQMPPVDIEHWRERRRAERAAKRTVGAPAAAPAEKDVELSDKDAVAQGEAPAVEPGSGRRRRRGRRRRGQQEGPDTPPAAPQAESKVADSHADEPESDDIGQDS